MFIAIGLLQEYHFGTAFCSAAGELNLPVEWYYLLFTICTNMLPPPPLRTLPIHNLSLSSEI
jgi:hypothetical protein